MSAADRGLVASFETTDLSDPSLYDDPWDFYAWFRAEHHCDESVFDDADVFRIDRDANPHIAFGFGTHFCMGAEEG